MSAACDENTSNQRKRRKLQYSRSYEAFTDANLNENDDSSSLSHEKSSLMPSQSIIEGSDEDNLHEKKWKYMFSAVESYVATNGHCKIPINYTIPFPNDKSTAKPLKLGLWLCTQKRDRKLGKLRSDRESKLQTLVDRGLLTWGDSFPSYLATSANDSTEPKSSDKPQLNDHRWEVMYSLLLKYQQENGHCNVPFSYKAPGLNDSSRPCNLGAWLNTQRQLKMKNELRDDRAARLQQLVDAGAMNWGEKKDVKAEDRWQFHYDQLLEYGTKVGHYNVKLREKVVVEGSEELPLGRWLDRTRSQYNKG
jgi:hypothetical protein